MGACLVEQREPGCLGGALLTSTASTTRNRHAMQGVRQRHAKFVRALVLSEALKIQAENGISAQSLEEYIQDIADSSLPAMVGCDAVTRNGALEFRKKHSICDLSGCVLASHTSIRGVIFTFIYNLCIAVHFMSVSLCSLSFSFRKRDSSDG